MSRFHLLLLTPLLLAGCATGEVLPHFGDGGGGELDSWTDGPSATEGGVDAAIDAAIDAATDAATDAAIDAAIDAATDVGLCHGPAGCDDGLACTDDICLEAGTCVNPLKPGHCLIAGVCHKDGETQSATGCNTCDSATSTSAWTGDASLCADDGLSCTSSSCAAGACTHPQQSGSCLIGGTCFVSGAAHPSADCLGCVPASSASTWSTLPDGSACSADGLTCTVDSCKAGTCTHATQAGSCLIGAACYTSGQTNPTGACSFCKPTASPSAWTPVSYQGCCVGATVVYCDSGTLQGLDCTANPSCGWDASFGYYDCGTSGSADPSGTNPKSCL